MARDRKNVPHAGCARPSARCHFLVRPPIDPAKTAKRVGSQSIQILEKRMISPKTMLYLIEAEGKQILIAESQLEVKRLESFSASSPQENA